MLGMASAHGSASATNDVIMQQRVLRPEAGLAAAGVTLPARDMANGNRHGL